MSALLHVRRPSGAVDIFLAEHYTADAGRVVAIGQFRWRSGRLGQRGEYTWPTARVIQIRHARGATA